jgi:N-acetylglucosaminyl-diphospho-decaprenol L-rhamnosyltransferase
MQLSVIIVNYNVCYFLEQCLYTVLKAAKGITAEVIVVDNASTDDSRIHLPGRFPDVQFIWNETNLGFGNANNQALELAKGEYLLLLNPDTLIPENALLTCLDFIKANPDSGAVGMRMYDGTGKYLQESKRGLPDAWTAFFKMGGFIRHFPTHPRIAKYYMGHLSPEKVQEVEVLAGAFMMIPRSVYEAVGGFDPLFFMYGEDIDLSYRITEAGYKNYYLPSPGIIHFKGESTTKDIRYIRKFYEAMQIFVRKHYGRQTFLWNWMIEFAILISGTGAVLSRWFQKRKNKYQYPNKWFLFGDKTTISELEEHLPGNVQLVNKLAAADLEVYVLGDGFGLPEIFFAWDNSRPLKPVRFHGRGTMSIIGSDDKNGNGSVMVLKKKNAI